MALHHADSISTVDGFPSHFLSLSLAAPNFQHQTSHTHMLTNMTPSVTLTPVGLSPTTTTTLQPMSHTSSLKGIVLPTHPLPPEQALGEDILATIHLKEFKPMKKVKSENGIEPTYVKCEFCDYCCDKKDRLSRHVRIVHYKERPFSCEMCEYSTGRKDKLKRHQATVHSQERPFKCDFCPHTSSRKDKLREHIQGVHLKNRPKRPKKKYPKKKKNQLQQQQAPQQQQQQQIQQQQMQQQQQQQQQLMHQQQQQQHQQLQQQLLQHPHQIVVSQGQGNGSLAHLLSASGNLSGMTMAQIPVSLVPVSVSSSGLTHYQIKQELDQTTTHHILS